jgi:hypothetical protein
LVFSHTGCHVDAICVAVGLQPADLFLISSMASTSTEPRQPQKTPRNRRREAAKPQGRAFASSGEAYCWPGTLSVEETLERLVALNQERAATIAGQFSRANTANVAELLETLVAVGLARVTADGEYAP